MRNMLVGILSIFFATHVHAATFNLTGSTPSYSGSGSFSIADSAFGIDQDLAFSDSDFLTFNFSVNGIALDLSNAVFPDIEGVRISSGAVVGFFANEGNFVDFSVPGIGLVAFGRIDGTFPSGFLVETEGTGAIEIGSASLSAVPLPSTLPLLGAALLALGLYRRSRLV